MPEKRPPGQSGSGVARPVASATQAGSPRAGFQGTGRWAPIGYTQRGAAGRRLSNLVKLYYVPVFALRDLLESRAPGQEFETLRQADLVRKADELPAVTEADVDQLYESARYGQRLAFYLYLLPSGAPPLDVEELQSILEELIAKDHPCRLKERCACQEFECETCPRQITLLDEEHWNGYREIRFRYYVTHRFLNEAEQPDEVRQSRYGFLWLEPSHGSLAVLTRDEQVVGLLTRALAQCLQVAPVPVRFPKELLDKHFSIEKARHLSYYDPGTGVRRCLSGRGLWQRFEQEISAREQEYARPTSLYDEEIAEGVVSGVGVLASRGKIYLTRTLPTATVRAWARQRLPELMRDVRELQAYRPETPGRTTETVQRMRLPSSGRAAIGMLVDGLSQTEHDSLTSVSLPQTALEICEALSGRYFSLYVRTQCGDCEQSAEACPHCESLDLDVQGQTVKCNLCGATLTDGATVTLSCMNGHVTAVPKAEAWSIAPNHWLQKRITRAFEEMGKAWDESSDYFHVEGNVLYRLRKGRTPTGPLPPVVQNYISNFWDPVTGQVHAGSGDIVTPGGNGRPATSRVAAPAAEAPPAAVYPADRTAPSAAAVGMGSRPVQPTGREQPGSRNSDGGAQPKGGAGAMLRREDVRPTVTYTPTFHGPIYGPTHTGAGDMHVGLLKYGFQADDLDTLFQSLLKLVEEQAPAPKKQEALQQVHTLRSAIQASKPDVSRMQSVLNWFKRSVPQLAGAVTSVVVHPIVGRVVEAAGEVAADELRRRFAR